MTSTVTTMTEREFQKTVIDLAHIYGWLVAHFQNALNPRGSHFMTPVGADGAGFPDLCMVKGERIIFAELKADRGRLSAKQENWLNCLRFVPHIEVYVWFPRDFDYIEEVLA